MRVTLKSTDENNDPLLAANEIPSRMKEYFLPNCERGFYYANDYEYLEQRYVSDDCIMCWLDINAHRSCVVRPQSDQPMMAIVYLLFGSIPALLQGFGKITLMHGFAYLFYVPADAAHEISLEKGYYRVMYCAIAEDYLANLAKEHKGIDQLLQMFINGEPDGLIEKLAPIKSFAQYQMWLVQHCTESKGFRESHLKARCVDLVLNYIKESEKYMGEKHIFNKETLERNEKIFRAKQLIDEHENGKISIDELASAVALPPNQLKKLFMEIVKQSIGQYQLDKRFERACVMLRETNMYLADIALKIGYQDESSLTRLFQQKTNMTPQEYRNKFKNSSKMRE